MSRVQLGRNQKGIVSFFVVMIIMVVLTLIVLAFAQLVRREQRQTLDRQLQTQALYAAESGVNDALDWLRDPSNQGDLFTWNDQCAGTGSFIETAGLDNDLDASGITSYSCLLVEAAPAQLEYTIPTDESVTLRLQPQTGVINELQISWQDNAGGTDVTCTNGVGSYPGNGNQNCTIGNVRLEILPFSGPTSRDDLINNRFVAYGQPGGSGTISWASGINRGQGQSAGASCSSGVCTLTITGVPGITLGYMRVGTTYRSSDVTIEAFETSSGTPLSMIGAQVEVDATGKASDVLHRIRVNAPIPLEGDGPAPEFALQTRVTQCKRFEIPTGNPIWYSSDPDYARCNPFQAVSPN